MKPNTLSPETLEAQKKAAALHALSFIKPGCILGVGTGSTINYFIEALASPLIKGKIEMVISSSSASTLKLQALGIPVEPLNQTARIDLYVDGADEVTPQKTMIKGGGAALTGEKILAAVASQFICIVDSGKVVDVLGKFPLPIEVIPMARSFVARALVKLGGHPEYRVGVVTEYGNVMLDVQGLSMLDPMALDQTLNQIPGIVTHGIFAAQKATQVIVGGPEGVWVF